jgi:hypothetical protein
MAADKSEGPLWVLASRVEALRGVVCPKTVVRWCKTGRLSARQFGARWFIHRDEVARLEADTAQAK